MVFKKDKSKKEVKDSKDMEVKEITIKKFVEVCPICKVEIQNNSESATRYNLKLHLEKHSKESKKE